MEQQKIGIWLLQTGDQEQRPACGTPYQKCATEIVVYLLIFWYVFLKTGYTWNTILQHHICQKHAESGEVS